MGIGAFVLIEFLLGDVTRREFVSYIWRQTLDAENSLSRL